MVEEAPPLLDVSQDRLLDDLQVVHRKHGDSEHPFALLETDSVHRKFGEVSTKQVSKILDTAFHAFNRVRKQSLRLYDGVLETLEHLSKSGIPVVAYTDARVINCLYRLRRLGVRQLFHALYAPGHVTKELDREIIEDRFVHLLPPTDRKPNPQALIDICAQYNVTVQEAVYVGDSLVRDVYMAREAGLHSAWAKYGTLYDQTLWPKLVRVTHWTDADVAREKELREQSQGVRPDFVLEKFADLRSYFGFRQPNGITAGKTDRY